jgi:ribosomal protein S18 acetylase RimI-like enzyme
MSDKIFIRKAVSDDFDDVMQIYAEARNFMRVSGNPDQWGDDYPPADLIRQDLSQNGGGHVATDGNGILAVFYFRTNVSEPDYVEITDGKWLNSLPYAVVHRLAIGENARGKGIGRLCLQWALDSYPNLKIDTHTSNLPMQRLLRSLGFVHCGSVYLADGSHRMAFQHAK